MLQLVSVGHGRHVLSLCDRQLVLDIVDMCLIYVRQLVLDILDMSLVYVTD